MTAIVTPHRVYNPSSWSRLSSPVGIIFHGVGQIAFVDCITRFSQAQLRLQELSYIG